MGDYNPLTEAMKLAISNGEFGQPRNPLTDAMNDAKRRGEQIGGVTGRAAGSQFDTDYTKPDYTYGGQLPNENPDNQPQNIIERYQDERARADMGVDPIGAGATLKDGGLRGPGYVTSSLKSGGYSTLAVGAGLINDVLGVSESDLAKHYKNDPEGLKKAKESLGWFWGRQAEKFSGKAGDIMAEVDLQTQNEIGNLKYNTLNPSESALLSPRRVLGDTLQSLPTSLALGLTAYLTRNAGATAEAEALAAGASADVARKAAIASAMQTAARVGAISEGVTGYKQQEQSVREEIGHLPQYMFDESPAYRDLLKQGYDPEVAKVLVAAQLGRKAGVDAGVIDATTNMVGGAVLGKIIGEGGTLVKRSLKGFANEAGVEAVQSGLEQVAQNRAVQQIDPTVGTYDNVAEQATQGAVVGGLTGAGFAGAMGHSESPNQSAIDAANRRNDPNINRAAIDALSPGDLASPLPNSVLATGRSAFDESLRAAEAPAGASVVPNTGVRPRAAERDRNLPKVAGLDKIVQITIWSETGGNRNAVSPKGAKSEMQVMDATNLDPGYGVKPAQNGSLEERARVGRDYIAAMLRKYDGDPAKAWAAYNMGPGAFDEILKEHPEGWTAYVPKETRSYVLKNLNRLGGEGFDAEGAIRPVDVPAQDAIDIESASDFVKRVLGEDFFNTESAAAPEDMPAPTGNIEGDQINKDWSAFSPESGSLGIPRDQMPQIAAEVRGALVNFLNARGIKSEQVDIPATLLKPTQAEFSPAKVQKAIDHTGGDRSILVSNDGYVLDGHHQWMAKREQDQPIKAQVLDASIRDLLNVVPEFPSASTAGGSQSASVAPATGADMPDLGTARTPQKPNVHPRANDLDADLLTFIAANGGINDNGGHSLRSKRNLQRFIPGIGSLIRPTGKSIDEMRERLVEVGWINDNATEADVLDMIERAAMHGDVFHPGSNRRAPGSAASQEPESEARARIQSYVSQLGLETFGETEMGYALENVAEGYDEERAIWAAMERAILQEFAIGGAPKTEKANGQEAQWIEVADPFPESGSPESSTTEDRQRPDAAQEQAQPGGSAPARPESADQGGVTFEDTPSGKGVIVKGLSEEQKAAIAKAVPKASGAPHKGGGINYSKKHEAAIREAISAGKTASPAEQADARTADLVAQAKARGAADFRAGKKSMPTEYSRGDLMEAWREGWRGERDSGITIGDKLAGGTPVEEAARAARDVADGISPQEKGAASFKSAEKELRNGDAIGFEASDGWTQVRQIGRDTYEVDKGTVVQEMPASAVEKIAEREGWARSNRTRDQAKSDSRKAARDNSRLTPNDDAAFEAVWTSGAFRKVAKELGAPHRESPVAHDMVRGWLDGKEGKMAPLDAHVENDRFAALVAKIQEHPSRGANSYNPIDPYVEGFYAAVMGEAREIRTVKAGDTWGVAQAIDAIEAKLEPRGNQDDSQNADAKGRKVIGKNKAGEDIWQDEKGVRAIKRDGIVSTEKVRLGAPGSGAISVDRTLDNSEYLTSEEVDAIKPDGGAQSGMRPDDEATISLLSRMAEAEDAGRRAPIDSGTLRVKMMIAEGLVIEGKGNVAYMTSEKGRALLDANGITHAQSPKQSAPTRPSGYGSKNKIVNEDRAAQARERIKAAMNRVNSGIDPELLAEGVILATYHIEAGARKFADFAKAVSEDLGKSLSELRPYLRAWYQGAQAMLEDGGEDVSDMDGPGAVRAAMTMIEDQAASRNPDAPIINQPTEAGRAAFERGDPRIVPSEFDLSTSVGKAKAEAWYRGYDKANLDSPVKNPREGTTPDSPLRDRIEGTFRTAFEDGRKFESITAARDYVRVTLGETIKPGTAEAKIMDEAIESAIIYTARQIAVRNESSPQQAYQKLVDLYNAQPKLGVRSSTSIEQQAYSTPVPLAYLASRLAGINQNTTVYEPTAGNGALLIDARPTYVTANELNPDRVAQLRKFLPGAKITENDALANAVDQVDVVIANPPFGAVRGDDGQSVRFQVDDRYSTNEIDHAIAMKALGAMKDGGAAVLIVGGLNKTIVDPKKRSDAYNGKAKREFYFRLYSQYNVVDHFTVDGALYERQGAGWPVDVIVIKGRGKSSMPLPAVRVPRQYESWDALAEVLNDGRTQNARPTGAESRGNPAQERGPAVSDVRTTSVGGERGNNRGTGLGENQQPRSIRGGSTDGQSSREGMGEQRRAVDQAADDQRRGGASGRDQSRVNPEVAENDKQVAYHPGSGATAMGTLVPVNMQTALSDALDNLAYRVGGDIDAFVSDRLGYEQADLYSRFGAEQIDAIALAIDNIERGAGFIIGDQTGIGKGRVVAAIIRYAIKQGRAPIFVTEKPTLYADMYRDMTDIGMQDMLGRDINIAMTNASQSIPLTEDGSKILKSSGSAKHEEMLNRLARNGLKAEGVDALFTTYSQMQTLKGQETERQRAIRAIASGGVLILDESHNAGGSGPSMIKKKGAGPNRAEFVRELVGLAHGVFYSSATYAKRPDVMDLYAATDMRLAVDDMDKLAEAIAKGGVPMQQVVAAMLSRAGQYVRRERSFDGIAYNTPVVEVDRGSYGQASAILKAIQDFSETYVKDATEVVKEEIKSEAETVNYDGSLGAAGARSTNFTAIMHNVINQMLLAFKADDAAQRAIAAIERGEKPVITASNTLETLLEEYAEDNDISIGQEMDISFADVFRRYLERSRWITIKKPFSEEKGEQKRLTDAQLGPAGAKAFRDAMNLIAESKLDQLPGSPIDYVLSKIEDAGYKTAEITGRTHGLNYRDGTAYLKARSMADRSIKGKIAAIRGFNDGTVDAIFLNRSGSTGLSLHASEKFKDKRKRRMILAQAEGNIDTHMQMLGRVHRTGQVVLPEYDQLVAGIPAEKRPAAVLAKKMASLNANTTASRDSALTSKEVLDFMNEYGDEVVARIMVDEPEINDLLGNPLAEKDEGYDKTDAARRVTGRIPLLPVDMQDDLYQRIEDEYSALLEQKDAAGENALEAKTFDLKAETLSSNEAVAPVHGSNSPFADGVNVERVSVVRLGKPYPLSDVVGRVAASLGVDPGNGTAADLTRVMREGQQAEREQWMQAVRDGAQFAEDAVSKIKNPESAVKQREHLNGSRARFQAIRRAFPTGSTVRLSTENGNIYGVITEIERTGKTKNPLALGSWKMGVALVDASRHISIPFSQILLANEGSTEADMLGRIKIEHAKSIGLFDIVDAFDNMQTESREERSIVTGNLLSGFDYVDGRGTIINYTTAAGEIKQGIMLSRTFNFEKHHASRPIALTTPEVIVEWLKESGGEITGQGSKGKIAVLAIPARDAFVLTAPKSKSDGGEFFLNKRLTAAMGGEFVSKSNGMVASSSMSRAADAIGVLLQSGVKFEIPAGASDEVKTAARALVEKYAPRETRKVEEAKPVSLAPKVSNVSRETFLNWKKSVATTGTVKGWTIFNDKIGGQFALMSETQMVAPFESEDVARQWANKNKHNEEIKTSLETAQPARTMTQEQRGELEARQQQGMARRGGQQSIKDQAGGLFSSERDQSDMFDRRESRRDYKSPLDKDLLRTLERQKVVWKKLGERLRQVGLGDKTILKVVDRLSSGALGDAGFRDGVSLIRIALSGMEDHVLNHEIIHILRDFDLIRPAEWTALTKAAQSNKRLMAWAARAYSELDAEARLEEAVAEMFAEWKSGKTYSSGLARLAMQRIVSFFDALRNIFRRDSALKAEAEAVMRNIDSGEIGGRPVGEVRDDVSRESRATNIIGDGKLDGIRERLDVWRTNMQDRMLPLLRTQQRIELQSGKALAEGANPYLAEELMSGKVGAKLEHLADEMVGPMFEQIKAEGLTVDEVETYLYARHAPERNARISEINPEFGEGTGSGMTDAEAQSIMERVEMEGKKEALERVAAKVDKILRFAIDTRVEAGLLSEEEADAWREQYQNYVPLRGKAEIDPESGEAARPRYGSGINVRGPESKRAFGRESRAADILAYSIMQAEEAVVRAGRNEVAKAFYQMVKANPDPSMWTIKQVRRVPKWNKELGQVTYYNDSHISAEDEPYTVSLKIDGSERRVTLNRDNPAARRLAKAMRNLGGQEFNAFVVMLMKFNQYQSKINTQYNPEFIISNAFRDIQTAAINLSQFDLKGLEAGTIKDYLKAGIASTKGAFGKQDGEWGRWYREFIDEGGRVYFNQVDDLEAIKKRIETSFADGSTARSKTLKAFTMVGNFVDNANNGVENAIRLSAYKNARERGMSKAQAASLAKNLTVNFNRKGQYGPWMNAAYVFYNASIQGSTRMMTAVFSKGPGGNRVRKVVAGIIISGFLMEALNMMMSGDDDDGESFYDKIPEFEKSHNIIVMNPFKEDGDYFKLPISYGYNVFYNMGRAAGEIYRGKKAGTVAANLFSSVIDAFNPVGGSEGLLNFVMPTVLDPLADILGDNRDFADRPIVPERNKFAPDIPDSQKAWSSTAPHWKKIAEGVNAATGGDEVVPGALDWSPETLEHWSDFMTGATGAFAERSFGLVEKTIAGDEIDANDLPLVRKVIGSKPSWYDKAAFYARKDEVEQAAHNLKEYEDNGDFEAADRYAISKEQILSLDDARKDADHDMRGIKKDRGALEMAREQGSITSEQYRAEKKSLDDQQKAVISNFNRIYLETVDNPTQP